MGNGLWIRGWVYSRGMMTRTRFGGSSSGKRVVERGEIGGETRNDDSNERNIR